MPHAAPATERFSVRAGSRSGARLARGATGGIGSLSEAEQNIIRQQETARQQQGAGGFTAFSSLLGTVRSPTGRLIQGGQPGQANLADIAGQQDIRLDQGQSDILQQFFSPRVNESQQSFIEALAKRASAQGLAGGAVRGRLGEVATQFIAGNRAEAFGGVQEIVGRRLGQIQGAAIPFLQQIGGLRSNLQAGGVTGLSRVLRAAGGTSGDFTQFAQTGLRALSAVGLGADALAGIARQQGLSFSGEGLTGAGDISQAFQQFLDPGTQAFGAALSQQGVGVQRGPGGFFRGRTRGVGIGGRNIGRANQRVGAGEQLAGRIGEITQGFASEAATLSALGTASISQFAQTGDRGAAQRLAGLDFSRFRNITQSLGIGQGLRQGQGQAGALGGTQFLAGNPLFRTVFGS